MRYSSDNPQNPLITQPGPVCQPAKNAAGRVIACALRSSAVRSSRTGRFRAVDEMDDFGVTDCVAERRNAKVGCAVYTPDPIFPPGKPLER